MQKWTFSDPTASEIYTLLVNPDAGGSPQYKKNLFYQSTSAPGGKTLVFEGQDEVQEIEFSGTLIDESQLDNFVLWFDKRRQIMITDDLDREFWVYIKSFEPTRVRNVSHPFKHTWKVSAVVLDWP